MTIVVTQLFEFPWESVMFHSTNLTFKVGVKEATELIAGVVDIEINGSLSRTFGVGSLMGYPNSPTRKIVIDVGGQVTDKG